MRNPFRYFNSSPEVIRLVVMMYIRYPLSLRQVEDFLIERGINIRSRDGSILVQVCLTSPTDTLSQVVRIRGCRFHRAGQ
jgi:hypothetical protein